MYYTSSNQYLARLDRELHAFLLPLRGRSLHVVKTRDSAMDREPMWHHLRFDRPGGLQQVNVHLCRDLLLGRCGTRCAYDCFLVRRANALYRRISSSSRMMARGMNSESHLATSTTDLTNSHARLKPASVRVECGTNDLELVEMGLSA